MKCTKCSETDEQTLGRCQSGECSSGKPQLLCEECYCDHLVEDHDKFGCADSDEIPMKCTKCSETDEQELGRCHSKECSSGKHHHIFCKECYGEHVCEDHNAFGFVYDSLDPISHQVGLP